MGGVWEQAYTPKYRYAKVIIMYNMPIHGKATPAKAKTVLTIMHGVMAATAKRSNAPYESDTLHNEANSRPTAAYMRA